MERRHPERAARHYLNISSFGEDEQGELYVVALGGTISRLAPDCTYTTAPASQSFGAAGGTGSATVTAADGCGWTAIPNASWLHVTSGASGSGNGIVQYTVDANTSGARSSSLTIAGHTLTVNQSGAATTCRASALSPRSATYAGTGGGGTISVTAPAGCNWTAVSNDAWIVITGGSSGSGNGTVTYTVSPFTGSQRRGTVSVGGLTFRVKQS